MTLVWQAYLDVDKVMGSHSTRCRLLHQFQIPCKIGRRKKTGVERERGKGGKERERDEGKKGGREEGGTKLGTRKEGEREREEQRKERERGRKESLPRVANSRARPCSVSGVWFTISTSSTMSYWLTFTYASA